MPCQHTNPPSNILPDKAKALKELRNDDSFVIVPADKGRATVVLDCTEYDDKIHNLLSDDRTYRKLSRNPTPALERRMNSSLLSLKKSGALPEPLYWRLHSSDSRIPLLYGLPKIYKPDVPLRPIMSFANSPTYQLSNTWLLCSPPSSEIQPPM